MAISRTIRDALDQLPGRAKALAGWDGSDVQLLSVDTSGNLAAAVNTDSVILASAARTATSNTADLTNIGARGLHLVIDVTAVAATPSVVFTIQGKDETSDKYYTILASAAITGTGTTVLKVYPGLTAAANTVASDVLPRTWRLLYTHADADSITYSVGASLIV